MVEIPDHLHAVFSAPIEEADDRYVISVPSLAVEHRDLRPGTTYRVAILNNSATAPSTEGEGPKRSESATSPDDDEGAEHPPTPPVEEGERRHVEIQSLGDQGDGIARVERGYVVIVPGATPGDTPHVVITEVRTNLAFAQKVESP